MLRSLPILVLILATAFVAAPPASHAAETPGIAAAKRSLAAAVDSASVPLLLQARARFQAQSAADPDDMEARLWVAVATWRVVPLLERQDRARAERVLRDGLGHAEEAVKRDPKSGEALAMKAALQGLLIRFDTAAMMTLGPESDANLVRARELSPASPRVWFLLGMHALHKPVAFGGSPAAALQQFEKSLELFAADHSGEGTSLDWGRADAYLWAGQASMKLGEPARAESLYRKALEIDPANLWVGKVLLPAARDSLARSRP